MVFVFGSNLDGNHAGGAARFALLNHGAEMGVAEGMTGNSYAIPTVGHDFAPLHIGHVHASIYRFMDFAHKNPDMQFQVTRIGCGIAGFKDSQIAPVFEDGMSHNVLFDEAWREYLPNATFWGTI